MGKIKYNTEEERKEAQRKSVKEWMRRNSAKFSIYRKKYQEKYKDTPIGRAIALLGGYKASDKLHNRGKGDLTPQWIVDNIFSKPCAHCGETDWTKIGCNRIDNSKPHTMDNVEPCCDKCNREIENARQKKRTYQYTLNNELVKIWDCLSDCKEEGFSIGQISCCCNGTRKTHKGYRWSYTPL